MAMQENETCQAVEEWLRKMQTPASECRVPYYELAQRLTRGVWGSSSAMKQKLDAGDAHALWSTKYEVLQAEGIEAEKQRRLDGQRPSKWPGALLASPSSATVQKDPAYAPSPDDVDAGVQHDVATGFDWNIAADMNWINEPDEAVFSTADENPNLTADLHWIRGEDDLERSMTTQASDRSLPLSSFLGHETNLMAAFMAPPLPLSMPVPTRNGCRRKSVVTAMSDLPSFESLDTSASITENQNAVAKRMKDTAVAPIPPSPTRALSSKSTLLVDFYFRETAQMYSCFDSQKNPFRSTVSQLWTSSPVIHSALQSMAASCLIENFPQMTRVGETLRREAVSLLSRDCKADESLLALLMLGGTANWGNPKDLGVSMFNAFKSKLSSVSQSDAATENVYFFQNSLVYWEMLLCYVSDNLDASHVPHTNAARPYFRRKHVPHPWTGIAHETQLILGEVGRLVRRQRVYAHSRAFASRAHIQRLQQAMAAAVELEKRLIDIDLPTEAEIISPEDRATPVWHLLNMAEVYRRTGLVQLYHVFPDLLLQRLANRQTDATAGKLMSLAPFLQRGCGDEVTDDHLQWLTHFTIDTLALIKEIPAESGTRDFQPFLLVALSSELRLPLYAGSSNDDGHNDDSDDEDDDETKYLLLSANTTTSPIRRSDDSNLASRRKLEFSSQTVEVVRMRDFVLGRLTAFLQVLPPSPIRICLQLVNETWAQMDEAAIVTAERRQILKNRRMDHPDEESDEDLDREAQSNVYWMDVMIEHGWEFVV